MEKVELNINIYVMLSWNQFRNLPNINKLPVNEQHRQYFIYESDMIYRSQSNSNQSNIGGSIGGRSINVADMYIDNDYTDEDYF